MYDIHNDMWEVRDVKLDEREHTERSAYKEKILRMLEDVPSHAMMERIYWFIVMQILL